MGEAIRFFQDRGVIIRIISGDNPGTVRAVAAAAGVNNSDAVTTGAELETWTAADFLKKVHEYAVFGRIKPEQKEKIIEALRQDGFTAMIGDGANDALGSHSLHRYRFYLFPVHAERIQRADDKKPAAANFFIGDNRNRRCRYFIEDPVRRCLL